MRWLGIVLFLLVSISVSAQSKKHQPTDRIESLNWDVIGSVRYDLTEQNGLMPRFSEMITRFEGRDFDLVGYIIPIKNGKNHAKFLLSALPINQCYFCGQNGIPPMILVEMENPVAYSEKTVHIQGNLFLARVDSRTAPPVVLKKSKLVQ